MKKPLLFIALALFSSFTVFGQEFQQPSEGKSLVYFARVSGTGALINFKYFDGEQYLGKMRGVHYFTYECDPGEHVFWVAAENRDFVRGDLKPNATYILEVRPTMGAVKAAVQLRPVSPDNEKMVKRVKKIIAKQRLKDPKGQEEDVSFLIESGMKRYQKVQDKSKVEVIDPNWTF
ncbi:hypothetical protein [Tunicatimonas pelagia]|uniref:hypothetical protein n=1 Tax=Tunicatimonas pelagia TaxID=931531 RepID=UPI002666AFFF|nr:hypothetical protein [Tunicatimonas pelagia]WKN40425.1 hypothetical protein P0M28_15380 [Tunicatimonas pelagia]